jgi:tetratricopeptide (TPR) repeat protein
MLTEVVELSEHALTCLEDALGHVDDSDGYMRSVRDRICELHHEACVVARPDPEELANMLFEWELYSEWETFYGAVETYADVLGSKGIETFRRLAEEVWAKVPAITSADERDRSHSGFRFNITHIMEALARLSGDVDSLVAVKSRDLSYAYHFVEIAELYRTEGRFDDALAWAEKGLSAFPTRTDTRMLEVLADEYHRRDRNDDALHLMWDAFAEASPPSGSHLGKHPR